MDQLYPLGQLFGPSDFGAALFIKGYKIIGSYNNIAGTDIMTSMKIETGQISTFSYPVEKIRNFSYSYSYPVNVGILRQNGYKFG